ncbi:hypothetical protein DBV23_03275 [Edwardsiella ictaluri]|nr:hypothetical protein DBV23_03275 [Edwardsiella ictaluri]KMQ77356.1 hypothetical protein ABY58_15080 [Edwardsiella ictaluri]
MNGIKMRNILSLGLASVLTLATSAHAAAPNYWYLFSTKGFDVYKITDQQGLTLTITCAEGYGSSDNSVELAKGSKSIGKELTLVMDDVPFDIPTDTYTTNDDAVTWENFFTSLKDTKEITVYTNNKKVAFFHLNAKNTSKIFSKAECRAKKNWEAYLNM